MLNNRENCEDRTGQTFGGNQRFCPKSESSQEEEGEEETPFIGVTRSRGKGRQKKAWRQERTAAQNILFYPFTVQTSSFIEPGDFQCSDSSCWVVMFSKVLVSRIWARHLGRPECK